MFPGVSFLPRQPACSGSPSFMRASGWWGQIGTVPADSLRVFPTFTKDEVKGTVRETAAYWGAAAVIGSLKRSRRSAFCREENLLTRGNFFTSMEKAAVSKWSHWNGTPATGSLGMPDERSLFKVS